MIVRKANVVGMRLLAVGLFVGGMVLISVPSLSLGLILAATVIACTTVVIDEIRAAKREVLEQKRTL